MAFFARFFWYRNRLLRYLVFATVLLILGQVAVLGFGLQPQEDPIFLHYTTAFGVDFVGAWYLAYLIPCASLLMLVVNGLLSKVLMRRDPFLSYLLLGGGSVVTLLLLIQTILLLYINA